MKLMTKGLEEIFKGYPLYSQEGLGMDSEVVVEYFNPCGRGTWLITEGSLDDDGDWLLFGYCHLFEWEWGYVSLSELEEIKLPFGLTIERSIHTNFKKVKEYFE